MTGWNFLYWLKKSRKSTLGVPGEILIKKWLESKEDYIYEEICRQYGVVVFRFAFKVVKNASLAEDIVQEVFMKLIEKPEIFKNVEKVDKFLIGIAYHIIIDNERTKIREINNKNAISDIYENSAIIDETIIINNIDKNKNKQKLLEYLMDLPDHYRIAISLYFAGYTAKEVANKMGVKEKIAQNYIDRSIIKIKQRFINENNINNNEE